MCDHTQHSRLETYCKISVRKRFTSCHTVGDLAPRDFRLFPALKEKLSGRVSAAMKLPPCGRRNRDITFCASGVDTPVARTVTGASAVKGTMVKKWRSSDTFVVCGQFPVLKSCL